MHTTFTGDLTVFLMIRLQHIQQILNLNIGSLNFDFDFEGSFTAFTHHKELWGSGDALSNLEKKTKKEKQNRGISQ